MKALKRLHRVAFEDDALRGTECFHTEDAGPIGDEAGHDKLRERAEVRVHDVERHLDRVEVEAVLLRDIEHIEVDMRVFVAGEADKADFAGLLRFKDSFHGAALGKDTVGVVEAQDFMMLE